jgi:hypothetical protein
VTAAEIDAALQKALERRRGPHSGEARCRQGRHISRAELDRFVDGMVAAADGNGTAASAWRKRSTTGLRN